METELNLDSFVFTKPQKHGDYLVCKVKYNVKDPVVVQFPKMKINNVPSFKNIELEFLENNYSKKIYDLLSNIDNFVVKSVTSNSEEWFNKKIPEDSISQMYNKFIKSPKTSENRCTVNLSFKTKKNELVTELIDRRGNEIDFEELQENQILECIAEMKYIIFSKDTCFVQWEISTAKLHRQVQKVARYGFIDDPSETEIEEPEEELEIHSFF
jgi:hypothetical protein